MKPRKQLLVTLLVGLLFSSLNPALGADSYWDKAKGRKSKEAAKPATSQKTAKVEMHTRIQALENRVTKSQRNQSAIWDGIDKLNQRVNTVSSGIKTLISDIKQSVLSKPSAPKPAMPSLSKAQQITLAKITKDLRATQANLNKLNKAIKSGVVEQSMVQDVLTKLEKRSDELHKQKAAIQAKQTDMPTQVDNNRQAIAKLTSEIQRLSHAQKTRVAQNAATGESSLEVEAQKSAEPKKKSKSFSDFFKPNLKTFLFFKQNGSQGVDSNEFGVGRAYFGGKIKVSDNVSFRLTFDAKSRATTAKSSGDTETMDVVDADGNVIGTTEVNTTSVSNSQGAYSAYLKYAYMQISDIYTKGLYLKLGQSGFIGITQLEKYWTYRFQGPMVLDREKYMSSTYIGLSVGYKSPDKVFNIQASAVNGEGYSKPERQKSKDGHLAIFVRPWAKGKGLLKSLVFGAMGVYGKYDEIEGDDLRLRLGGVVGLVGKQYCLFGEFNYLKDPTSEAASRAKKISGSKSPIVTLTSDLTTGQAAAVYGWLDFGLFSEKMNGFRLVGRFDWADPSTDIQDDHHQRAMVGLGYVFNKHFQVLLNGEFTTFAKRAGYDSGTETYSIPDALTYYYAQAELKF